MTYAITEQNDVSEAAAARNVPIAAGTSSDSLLAVVDGEFVVMRVPYPLGFYTRGMDGRIDDPSAGWRGKGVWADFRTQNNWHIEGARGRSRRWSSSSSGRTRSRIDEATPGSGPGPSVPYATESR